ncbi:MAG: hypothetical protein F4081_03090 [Dehalococcoidia bacterium]|nr:hypothetical protein [Dehalococcoidia bacterium]MYI85785.1 hypothetical protein [Dehalococcoidia bacterium]
MSDGEEAVRFLDVLTTASSVAHARRAEAVSAAHMLEAIDVLTGASEPDGADAPVSPLGHRRAELSVEPAVRDLTQRWFARLGGAPEAVLGAAELGELRAELESLIRS